MKKLFYTLVLTTMIAFIFAGPIIIPDDQNKMLGALNTFADSSLVFNFKLTNALQYNQFIAVRFPAFDQAGAAKTWDFKANIPTCNLFDNTGKAIQVTGVASIDAEKMIAYCQLTDVNNIVAAAKIYRLSINVIKSSGAEFYPNFDLMTSTTNDMTKGLLIDSGNSFGNANSFISYKDSGNALLKVESVTKVKSDGTADTTKTYAYETFNVKMEMKIMACIMGTASLISFEYPNTNLVTTLPTSYVSTDYVDPAVTPAVTPVPAKYKALAGSFTIAQTSATVQVVSGIAKSEYLLHKDRKFNFIAKGLIAGDGLVTKQKLNVRVYYKNSMVIQSYYSIDFVQTTKATVTFKVTHPETWDIYMSGAWPLKFSYKVSQAITKPSYVRIQHSNMNAVSNVWNFIASTCNFSMNTAGFEKDFGKRNNCFPLWQSLNYPTLDYSANNKIWSATEYAAAATVAGTLAYLGSGIYFRQVAFVKDTEYFVKIWGVADVCGRNSKGDPLVSTSAPATKVEFLFKFDIFSKIDQTTDALFSDNDKIVTQKQNATGAGNAPTCYTVFRGATVTNISTDFELFMPPTTKKTLYLLPGLGGKVVQSVNCQVPASNTAAGDQLFYKEITDPVIIKQTATTTPPSSGTYGFSMWDATNGGLVSSNTGVGYQARTGGKWGPAAYLYSATSANALIGKADAILIRGDAAVKALTSTVYNTAAVFPNAMFMNLTAAAKTADSDAPNSLYSQQAGSLEIYFCKEYFALNAIASCVVSWHHGMDVANTANQANKTNIAFTKTAAVGANQSFWMGPAAQAGSSSTIVAFPTDANMNTNKALRAKELRNTFIKAPSDATSSANGTANAASLLAASSVWPKADGTHTQIKIVSVANAPWLPGVGGEWFTTDAAALGNKPMVKTATNGAPLPAFSVAANKGGAFTMHLYTNCLKWAASSPANRDLFSSLDIVWRYMPAIQKTAASKAVTVCSNGPNRVIRFIKMYAESKGMNDIALVTKATNTGDGLIFHNVIAPSASPNSVSNGGRGATCLVEIDQKCLNAIKDASASYNIALFLWNVSLLNTDITNPATTYPVGGLNATAKAYGLSSGPAYGRFGLYGGFKGAAKDTWMTLAKSQVEVLSTKYVNLEAVLPITNKDATEDKRTQYNFILGSVVLITGIPSNKYATEDYAYAKTTENLMIPTNCPPPSYTSTAIVDAGLKDAVGAVYNAMTGYMIAFKGSGFSKITSIDKQMQSGKESLNLIIFSTIKSTATLAAFNTNLKKFDIALSETKKINIKNSSGGNVKYTSISIFLNKAFTFEDSKTTTTKAVLYNTATYAANKAFAIYAPTSNNNFYVEGRKFNYAAYYTVAVVTAADTNAVNIHNIIHPTNLSVFYNGTPTSATGAFTLKNFIGVTTAALATGDFLYGTNFKGHATEATGAWINTWLLNTKNKVDGTAGEYTMTVEKVGGTQYKDDKAGNVKFVIKNPTTLFPATMAKWATMQFEGIGSIFSTTTICGITNSSGASFPCTNTASKFTCPILKSAAEFTVCCYAVILKATAVTYGIKYVGYILNGITTSDSDNLIYILKNSNASNAVVGYTVDNANNSVFTTLVGSVSTPSYSILQEGAIGQMIFTVTLPRQPVRSGSISLTGNFKILVIDGYLDKIRCIASFSALNINKPHSWQTTDSYIKSCDISGLNSDTTGVIIVNTQSFAWKCGTISSTKLYISLSPVKMSKFPSTKYVFAMKQGSNTIVSTTATDANTKGKDITITSPTLSAVKPIFQADTLCGVASAGVYPRIPHMPIDFTFTFDLTTKKTDIDKFKLKVNELTIAFVPSSIFSDWANSSMKDQWCSIAGKRQICSFSSEGLLTVTLESEATTGKNIAITVHGVPVGSIIVASAKTFKFLCTANNLTGTTRLNLITGSGIMKNSAEISGVQGKSVLSQTFNMRFFAQEVSPTATTGFSVSNANPRVGATVSIRVGVDNYGTYTAQKAITIKDNPVFHVILPSQYESNFQYQFMASSALKPTMTVADWSTDSKGVLKSTAVKLKATTFSGTRITSLVDDKTLVISDTHRYFEIKIAGLINPSNEGKTGQFEVVLTTTKYDWMLRTVCDIQSQSTGNALTYNVYPIPTNSKYTKISQLITSYRGLNIASTKKWVASLDTNNIISIKAGRFSQHTFTLAKKTVSQGAVSAVTSITSSDTKFKFPTGSKYELKTVDLSLKIQIGTACANASTGMYVLSLVSSDTTNFVPLAPITVNLLSDTKGTLKVVTSTTTTIAGGTLVIDYTLPPSDTNFEEITGTWTGVKDNFDVTATISPVKITANSIKSSGLFAITKASVTTAQQFTLALVNKCFVPSNASLSITPSEKAPTLPAAATVAKWFVYKDPKATDFALKSTTPPKLNGLLWVITPTVFPVYIYCAVICKSAAALTKDAIIAQKLTIGYLAQQYNNYFKDATATNMIFSGLVRGQAYQLQCQIQTTQASSSARTTVEYNQNSFKDSSGNLTNITPTVVESTQCLEITITTKVDIPVATKNAVQQYCQDMFSPAKDITTGCIICVDLDSKAIPPSKLPVSKDVTCGAASSKRLRYLNEHRELTTNKTTPAVVVPATKTLTVCAVQSVICNSNLPSPGISAILEKMKTALKDKAGVLNTVNIKDVEVKSLSIISDKIAPTFPNTIKYGIKLNGDNVVLSATNYTITNTLDCYFKIQDSSTAPTATDIKTCTDANKCSKFIMGTTTTTVTKPASKALTLYTTSYNAFSVCYNRVPGASQKSVIMSYGAVTKTCATGSTVSTDKKTCNTPTVVPSPTGSTSMYTIVMSLIAMIMINILLFN